MTYRIIRHYSPDQDRENETVKTGLTLKEARAHCRRDDTHEKGKWFDGYEVENPTPEMIQERRERDVFYGSLIHKLKL